MDWTGLFQTLLTPLVWVLNGVLVLAYNLATQWQSLALIPLVAWLAINGPKEHRPWGIGVACTALITSLLALPPVPIFLLVMAGAALGALQLEKFNPDNLHWRTLSGLALYCLIALGITSFLWYVGISAGDNLLLAQGQAYISIMGAVGLYGYPLGYLAMLAQAVFIHPPIPGGVPQDLINTVRSRRQD